MKSKEELYHDNPVTILTFAVYIDTMLVIVKVVYFLLQSVSTTIVLRVYLV